MCLAEYLLKFIHTNTTIQFVVFYKIKFCILYLVFGQKMRITISKVNIHKYIFTNIQLVLDNYRQISFEHTCSFENSIKTFQWSEFNMYIIVIFIVLNYYSIIVICLTMVNA